MAGIHDTDIKLDSSWQLTQAANGDAPIASGFDCIIQDIRLEAISQEGELFYDSEWGWSLVDFIQSEDDDLTIIEISDRIRSKLEKRDVIDPDTISTGIVFENEALKILATFSFMGASEVQSINILVDRVNVEVIEID